MARDYVTKCWSLTPDLAERVERQAELESAGDEPVSESEIVRRALREFFSRLEVSDAQQTNDAG